MKANETGETLRQKDRTYLIHPLTPLRDDAAGGPLVIVRGEGCKIFDIDGKEYIDALAGLWNCTLGHGRRDIIRSVVEQMERIAYVTTFHSVSNDTTIAWAERLAHVLPGDLKHIFPNVTGSEANDTALKFTRMYFGLSGQPSKVKVFSHHRAYHGAASGVVGATGIFEYWKHFMPMAPYHMHVPAPHCYRCPYGKQYPDCRVMCADVLEQMILAEEPSTVAAFMGEPVIGAGGVIIPKPEYYRRVRDICDRYDVVYIDDEVITGFGRTGRWFGIEHFGVVPDILTMGKGMTAGYLPMFATAVNDRIHRLLADSGEVLFHGFTYTGQPALCAAALRVMEVLESERLIARVSDIGTVFASLLDGLTEYPWVGDVRSIGLMGGVEFVSDKNTKEPFGPEKRFAPRMTAALRKHGVLGRVLRGDSLALAPAFTIPNSDLEALFQGVRSAIEEVCPTL